MRASVARYVGNCTTKPAFFVDSVMDHAKDITYKTFIRYVHWQELVDLFPVYDWNKAGGLKIWDDYAVSFYKCKVGAETYYIVKHSSIEYFFLLEV